MTHLSWEEFERVEMRVGTVKSCENNVSSKKPAFLLTIDFGLELGVLKSSAQITNLYKPEAVIGSQVIAVVNFPKKQIGKMMSECLVLGMQDENGAISLLRPDHALPNGSRVC
jgi:tRNA-binding protein